jgi:uncharacterized membrane protein
MPADTLINGRKLLSSVEAVLVFKVTITTEIEAPAEVVYAYLADLSNNSSWQSGIASTNWTSRPPIRVGSTYDQRTEYKDMVIGYEVTAIDPGRSITVESRRGANVPTTVTRTVQELDESRCRVEVDLVGELRSWRQITTPMVTRAIRRAVGADYRQLKEQLEADQSDSG